MVNEYDMPRESSLDLAAHEPIPAYAAEKVGAAA